jgi:hypothetical protein
VCLSLIGARVFGAGADLRAPLIAGGIGAGIAILFFVIRPRQVIADDEVDPAAAI